MPRLWYIKRGEQVAGPFPEAALRQDLLLGRLDPGTGVSTDQESWGPARSYAEFSGVVDPPPSGAGVQDGADDWAAERREATRRWADERSGQDRRGSEEAPGEAGRRAGGERRNSGTERPPAEPRESPSEGSNRMAWRVTLVIVLVLVALLVLAYVFGPVNPVRVRIGP